MIVRPAKTQIRLGIRPVWSVFAVHMKKAWVLSYPFNAQQRLWSDWADVQADLSLRWAHNHFVGFVMRRLKWADSDPTGSMIQIDIGMWSNKDDPLNSIDVEKAVIRFVIWATACKNLRSKSCDQVRHKPICTDTEAYTRLGFSDTGIIDIILSGQRIIKMLIRLRACAGWSAPLLFAYGIKRLCHASVQCCKG